MEIIYKNFLKLLSIGAFDNDVKIESMSPYKWRQVLSLAQTYNVQDFISIGIITVSTKYKNIFSKDFIENAYAQYDSMTKSKTDDNTLSTQKQNEIPNFYFFRLNHKIKNIVYNEIHGIDTSTLTLALFYLIVENVNELIYKRINYRLIIKLGKVLRNNGDKIDFVKIDKWINTLGIKRQVNHVGSFLVRVFNFDEDEVQFISRNYTSAYNEAIMPLRYTLVNASNETDIRDYDERIKRPLVISDTHSLCRFAYFPTEVLSKFVKGCIRSLSNIEE